MKVLIVLSDKTFSDLVSLICESVLGYSLVSSSNLIEGLDKLKEDSSFNMIICEYPTDGVSFLIKHIKDNNLSLGILFALTDAAKKDEINELGFNGAKEFINVGDSKDVVQKVIQNLAAGGTIESDSTAAQAPTIDSVTDDGELDITNIVEDTNNDEFYRIHFNFFIKETKTPCDLYLKMSERKYVRIFAKGADICADDFIKYKRKNSEYFYIKSDEYFKYSQRLITTLSKASSSTKISPEKASNMALYSHEHVHEIINKIGLKKEVSEITEKAVKTLVRVAEQNPRVTELIKNLMRNNNYLSEHSTMLAHLNCAIANEFEWKSELTYIKLCSASYLHDMVIKDEKIAQIDSLDSEEAKALDKRTLKQFEQHPFKSAELVSAIEGLPPDVDKIIMQHHEKPDGTGFPRGIDHKKIYPLACIFIVAEDYVHHLYKYDAEYFISGPGMSEFEEKYSDGSFKKAYLGLKRAVLENDKKKMTG